MFSSPHVRTPVKRSSNVADIPNHICGDFYKRSSKKICTSNITGGSLDSLASEAVHFLSHVSLPTASACTFDANQIGSSDSQTIMPPLAFLEYIGVSQSSCDSDHQHQIKSSRPLPVLPGLIQSNICSVLATSPIPGTVHHMNRQSCRTATPCTARVAQCLRDLQR